MIVYLANKARFRDDILSNRIEEIVLESFQTKFGKSVGESELFSWKHSRRHMDTVLEDADVPNNAGLDRVQHPADQQTRRLHRHRYPTRFSSFFGQHDAVIEVDA